MIKKAIAWAADAFEDHRGGTSYNRLASFMFLFNVQFVWTASCYDGAKFTFKAMDPLMAGMVLLALGISAGKSLLETASLPKP